MQIKKQKSRLKIGVTCLFLFAIGGAGTYAAFSYYGVAAEPPRPAIFSFDAAAAPGWYQSKLDTSTVEGRRSLLVFDHDPSSPAKKSDLQSCHVSAFLSVGSVSIQEKLAEITASDGSGRSVVSLGTRALALQLPSSPRTYELHMYTMVVPAGASPIKAGNAFGYVQTEDYYVELQAVCDTPEQLESTIPALQAIRFDDTVPAN